MFLTHTNAQEFERTMLKNNKDIFGYKIMWSHPKDGRWALHTLYYESEREYHYNKEYNGRTK